MTIRGIRGATTVANNKRDEILAATKELLSEILNTNQLKVPDIASIIFTVTKDLNAEFPAVAARELGWNETPLLCNYEIDVPKSLAKCIRVLLLVNSDKTQKEIKHIYLKEAVNLRR
ncbi:MAG: chorismate mutase [Candidatus Margulisiibacteriota bacterium]